MKTVSRLSGHLLISLALVGLSAACRQKDAEQAKLQSRCQLQQVVSTATTLGSTENSKTLYDYDASGNLIRKALTSTATYSVGGGSTVSTVETYAYTSDNFLTAYTYTNQRNVNFVGAISTFQRTQTRAYTYANDRLAGYTQSETVVASATSPSVTTNSSVVYEYDAAGQLLKEISTFGSRTATWTYQNGRAVDYVEKTGSVEARPLTLQNGLVTQFRYAGTQSSGTGTIVPYIADTRFQYDERRRLIQQQQVTNDALDSYFTQSWQSGAPAELTVPRFKGHPVIQSPYGETGVLTQKKIYEINKQQANTVYPYLEYTYVHQLNSQDVVTNTQVKTVHFTNGQQQPDLNTLVYTYSGCN